MKENSINKLNSAPLYDLTSIPFCFHLDIDSLGTIKVRVCGEYITIDEKKLLEFIKTLGVERKNE